MSATGLATVPAAALAAFVEAAFRACGLSPRDAVDAADVLAYADLAGLDGHGVANLERVYVRGLLEGRIRPDAAPTVVRERAGAATLDGHQGIGLVVGRRAMEDAIARARAAGVGAVAVRNGTHLGAAGYYAAMAAAAGMVGLTATNLGAQRIVRPPGGSSPLLGTNPIGAAAPAGAAVPFVLDMSTTVVPTGRVRAAARRGQSIPTGWLEDDAGEPVRDPAAYDEGRGHLLWLGGAPATGAYKGFGLAVFVEVLCGALAGAAIGPVTDAPVAGGPDDIGSFFLALDVEAFRAPSAFAADMDAMLAALQGDGAALRYPGLPEAELTQRRRADGIPVDEEVAASLERVAARLSLTSPVGVR